MATTQAVRVPSPTPPYRDLVSELTKHSWIGVLYAVGTIVFLYLLGFTANASALFLAAEVPAVCIVTAVLRHDVRLRLRVPLIWSLTAAFIWALPRATENAAHFSWPNEIAAASLALLFAYWLTRAVRGSINESRREHDESSGAATVANLSSVWGATLTIVNGTSLLVQPFLIPIIEPTTIGRPLVGILALSRRIALWNWFPPGLLLFGLALFASLRFKDDPYRPRNYQEILLIKLPPVLNELFAILRLPVWLCVVVIGFLIHFTKQVWLSLVEFFDEWVGRTILILLSLVIPTALICVGHFIILKATDEIAGYLSGGFAALTVRLNLLLTVHLLVLLGMCLYLIAAIACALEIVPLRLRQIYKTVKNFIVNTGFPAGDAVGRSFSLYGILFIAVPIAAMIPGGPGIGLFSIVYATLVLLAVATVAYLKVRSDASIKALRIELISLRLFEAGSPSDSDEAKNYSNKFACNQVRSIYWHLCLKNAAPKHRTPLDIVAEWGGTRGEVIAKRTCRTYVESGSTTCTNTDGLGSAVSGQFWSPGTYSLKLYVGSASIARAQFEISATSPVESRKPRNPSRSWYQRYVGAITLAMALVILAIVEPAGAALVDMIKPHPALWLKIILFVWSGAVALILGLSIAMGIRDGGLGKRATLESTLLTLGLTVAFGIILLVVRIAGKIGLAAPPPNPSGVELASFTGTHWRGRVGRAPASLDVLSEETPGALKARVHYEGIAEDLLLTRAPDGMLTLRGKGFNRENGNGSFALDTFYGHVSPDEKQIQGYLMDGSHRRGEWAVTRFTPGADMAAITAKFLSPSPTLSTQWLGTVGNWPATIEIMPRKADEWIARVTYHNVTEDLAVSVKEDGSVLLVGRNYKRVDGEGSFSLDTFYGQPSSDGERLEGLRVDAAQTRGPWSVSKAANLPLENHP